MQLRERHIQQLGEDVYDVLIIGGGINGAVSAAALAGKGAKVALIDRGDFGGFTSSNSSNLIWGGIKYMERYEFALVRRLCLSRNLLIKSYPSTVQEIRFFTTIHQGFRYRPVLFWMGIWLYWLMGSRFTRMPRLVPRTKIPHEEKIIDIGNALGAFEYSDAYLNDNDSRFVFNFIRSAIGRGCIAANYVESLGGSRENGIWTIKATEVIDGREFKLKSKALINAAGPFVDEHNKLTGQKTAHHHIFSKGIHLIVERLTPHRRVLAFFADDGRLFFAIPMGRRTCIGTTDTPVDTPFAQVSEEDQRFVLDNINKRLKLDRPLAEQDVIATRCGVRPLAVRNAESGNRDWLRLSRRHAIDVNRDGAHLSIFGGKLTDCINVGNEVCVHVKEMGVDIPDEGYKWYGEPSEDVKREFLRQAQSMDLDSHTCAQATEKLTTRYWRRYGSEAFALLEQIRRDPREAERLIKGTEYTHCEIYQAARREMVTKLEDFLRRRSKIAQVIRHEDIRNAEGLMEACEILFADKAKQKYDEYLDEHAVRHNRTHP